MRLLVVSSTIACAAVTAFAQEPTRPVTVRREVFADHPAINVVYAILRAKRSGQDGVLIVGGGVDVSMSCFVPDGGTASCSPLELSSIDGAQPLATRSVGDPQLLVKGLWGKPAIGLLDRNGKVAWRYDAEYTAMGHFAILESDSPVTVVAERGKGLLFFDALTGKLRNTVHLPGDLTDVYVISGADGHPYLMGLTGDGRLVVLSTAGNVLRATPNIGVFHAAMSQGDNPALFIAPKDTLYTIDDHSRAGGWYAPESGDLRISAVDRTGGSNGAPVAMFIGSGSSRDKTRLYVFGPNGRLLHTDSSLYPNSGLLLLSSSERSLTFLVGDRARTWQYTVTW